MVKTLVSFGMSGDSDLEVVKLFSCSVHLSMKFAVVIDMKMPTKAGIFGRVFNPSFKIVMSGRAGGRASAEVYLLVNLFSKLCVTFILQWILFMFGRDEEEDQ